MLEQVKKETFPDFLKENQTKISPYFGNRPDPDHGPEKQTTVAALQYRIVQLSVLQLASLYKHLEIKFFT